jgi:hypothetical protein
MLRHRQWNPPLGERLLAVRAFPEGEDFETASSSPGRTHKSGEIRFRVAVDPGNQGVRIRRRIDQKSPRQKALVYVDGAYAGCWYDGYRNENLRWADSNFELSPVFTRGKSALRLRLVVQSGDGEGAFSDFGYEVFCYVPDAAEIGRARIGK